MNLKFGKPLGGRDVALICLFSILSIWFYIGFYFPGSYMPFLRKRTKDDSLVLACPIAIALCRHYHPLYKCKGAEDQLERIGASLCLSFIGTVCVLRYCGYSLSIMVQEPSTGVPSLPSVDAAV